MNKHGRDKWTDWKLQTKIMKNEVSHRGPIYIQYKMGFIQYFFHHFSRLQKPCCDLMCSLLIKVYWTVIFLWSLNSKSKSDAPEKNYSSSFSSCILSTNYCSHAWLRIKESTVFCPKCHTAPYTITQCFDSIWRSHGSIRPNAVMGLRSVYCVCLWFTVVAAVCTIMHSYISHHATTVAYNIISIDNVGTLGVHYTRSLHKVKQEQVFERIIFIYLRI